MKNYFAIMFAVTCAMISAQNQNVGINTDNPHARLEVQTEGNTAATHAIIMQNADGQKVFEMNDDGNLAIGKSSPTGTVDVLGNAVSGNDFLIQKPTAITSFNGTPYTPNFRHMRFGIGGSYNNGNPGGQLFLFDVVGSAASNVASHGINIIPANPNLTRKGVYFGGDKTVGFSLNRLPTVDLDAGGSIRLRESEAPITAGAACTNLNGVMQYYKGHFYGCRSNVWVQLDN